MQQAQPLLELDRTQPRRCLELAVKRGLAERGDVRQLRDRDGPREMAADVCDRAADARLHRIGDERDGLPAI